MPLTLRGAFLVASLALAHVVAAAEPVASDGALPSASHEWSGAEYDQLGTALRSGTVPLPRFADEAGAALLRRMTSNENLSAYRDRRVPVQTRIRLWLPRFRGMHEVFKAYLRDVTEKGARPGKELAALQACLLEIGALGADLNVEFLRTVQKDDKSAQQVAAVNKMNKVLPSFFSNAEIALATPGFYAAEDVSKLVVAMDSALPHLKKVFTPELAVAIRGRLEADRVRLAGKDRAALERMIGELR